jgi:hypothetical protein
MNPAMTKVPKQAMTLAAMPVTECHAEGIIAMQTERLMGSTGRKKKCLYMQESWGMLLFLRQVNLLQKRDVAPLIQRYGWQICRP